MAAELVAAARAAIAGVCQGVERKKCGRPSNCENWRQSGKFCDAVECGVLMVEC